MARKIVVMCDLCLEEDREVPGSAHTISVDGEEFVNDLCAEDWDMISGPLRELKRLAQPSEPKKPWPCPLCSKTYETDSGLRPHMVKEHDMDLNDYETQQGHTLDGRPLTHFCSCGKGWASGRGLAFHRKKTGHAG